MLISCIGLYGSAAITPQVLRASGARGGGVWQGAITECSKRFQGLFCVLVGLFCVLVGLLSQTAASDSYEPSLPQEQASTYLNLKP